MPWLVEMSKHSMRSGGASSAKCAFQLQQGVVDALILVVGAHLVAHAACAGRSCSAMVTSSAFSPRSAGPTMRTLAPCALASLPSKPAAPWPSASSGMHAKDNLARDGRRWPRSSAAGTYGADLGREHRARGRGRTRCELMMRPSRTMSTCTPLRRSPRGTGPMTSAFMVCESLRHAACRISAVHRHRCEP